MRTTLTLEDDIAMQLKEVSRRTGQSFKEIVNQTLARGLRLGDKPATQPERFEVKAKARGFKPGIDLMKLNQLVDELEVEDFKRKLNQDLARS